MTQAPRIAVLMTCYNRRELTLACLENLRTQPLFTEEDLYLVDDGCSDATGDAVAALLPCANVISGNGSLFWNGGMRLAWQTALASDKTYDFYLWLNDDVALYPHALDMLVQDADATAARGQAVLVAAATVAPGADTITYGAHLRQNPARPLRLTLVAPTGAPIPVDSISGNIVLVSAGAERRLGNLHDGFEHIYGDIDYGIRARQAGIPVVLASRIGGTCASNDIAGTSLDRTRTRWERVRLRWREDRRVHARDWQRLVSIHSGGRLMALLHRAAPYLRILLDRPNRFANAIIDRSQTS